MAAAVRSGAETPAVAAAEPLASPVAVLRLVAVVVVAAVVLLRLRMPASAPLISVTKFCASVVRPVRRVCRAFPVLVVVRAALVALRADSRVVLRVASLVAEAAVTAVAVRRQQVLAIE